LAKKAKKKLKKSKSRKKTPGFQFFVFGLNCLLCFIVAVLVLYEIFRVRNVSLPIAPIPNTIFEKPSPHSPNRHREKERDYIAAALEMDEMQKNDAYAVENMLHRASRKNGTLPSDGWKEKVAYINKIDLSSDDIYNFYEEELPEDIEEKNVEHLPKNFIPARKPHYQDSRPKLAIVIDDMGVSHQRTSDISSLHYPLTSSFLTYASDLPRQIEAAKAAGHEIIAHLPMEPLVSMNVSPDVLTVKMNKQQIQNGIVQMLNKFPNIKGVNNHMGSRFTEDKERLGIVMKELKRRNLFFLDSKTTPRSAGLSAAKEAGVSYIARNVFIDNKDEFDYIVAQLEQSARIARQNGRAIAIGHPKAQTYKALKNWLPKLQKRGIRLVHLSEMTE